MGGKEVLLKSKNRARDDKKTKRSGKQSKAMKTSVTTSSSSARPKDYAVERWHRLQQLETKVHEATRVKKQDEDDIDQTKQPEAVQKVTSMQTTAKAKPKKRPTPVGSIAEALKLKIRAKGSGSEPVPPQKSTDRIIDATFWVKRLKHSAKQSASSSAYDSEVRGSSERA